ncbi:hypothetical protein [Aeromicrobium sp. UC242_57]|uniref:hypothetical protein n=1 Tax=Aeromicrobium sp. UC242_57 TaxID=3374624 RepID=UPI00378E9A1C
MGRIGDSQAGVAAYVKHLVGSSPRRLDGMKIVLDCANGAAYDVGPSVLEQARRDRDHDPCRARRPQHQPQLWFDAPRRPAEGSRQHGAHAGFAFDGDADRCLAVDETGAVVDGDHILAILALAARDAGRLTESTVVATVISNLGFVHALEGAGITVVQTAVGDRYVLEAMRTGGFNLGGEQSGHVIMGDYATTGDGVLTAVHIAARMRETGSTLSELASVMTRLPQVLVNVPDVDKSRAETDPTLQGAVAIATARLGDTGRVLLRQSGTEPLVRVMVEATTPEEAAEVADYLASIVRSTLAL